MSLYSDFVGVGSSLETYSTVSGLPLGNNETGDQAFVTANNRLYLWNGEGWYSVALMNLSPTTITGNDELYEFEQDGTPLVITLVSEDPEGFALTWSHAVTSGTLGSTATIEQADNVFTITPSTSAVHAGDFGVTFSVTEGTNITTSISSFNLAFGPDISYGAIHETGTYTHNNETWTWVSMNQTTTFTCNDCTVHLLMVGRGGMLHYPYLGGGGGGEMEYHKDLSLTAGTYDVVIDNGTSGTPGVSITQLSLFAAKGMGGGGGSPSTPPYWGGHYFEDGVQLYSGGVNQYGGEAGSGAGSGGPGGASVNGSTGGVGGPGTAEGGIVRDRNNSNANTTLQITGGYYAGYSGGAGGTNNVNDQYAGSGNFGGGTQSQTTFGPGVVILTYLGG